MQGSAACPGGAHRSAAPTRRAEAPYHPGMKSYACAICARPIEYDGPLPPLYPFCSERCRLVDLGKWLRGQYAINRDLTPEEIEEQRGAGKEE